MKRLIVCNDGTWNSPDQEDNGIPSPTNVVKLYNSLAERDVRNGQSIVQNKYYHPGVGADGGILNSITGGAVGAGISNHIRSAYHWLATNYEAQDEIYLYGFSRGAFTSRSLAGLLSYGLLDLRDVKSAEAWKRVESAYDKGYRKKIDNRQVWAKPDWKFFHPGATPIHFIGVWDTVGALGVPDDLEILNFFDDNDKWCFHDTDLGENVKFARHAMAIDETRASFTVTRWTSHNANSDLKEVWFPGVHSDVGGGYAVTDLSDGALIWMLDESAKAGLCFRDGIRVCMDPQPLGTMHNSFKGAFAKLRSRPRAVEALIPENHAHFHESAIKRHEVSPIGYPAYRPTKILQQVGDSATVDVFADTRWNDTGIFLNAGHGYTFSATGEWVDSKDACDWRGTEFDDFSTGDVVRATGTFLGKFEWLFKKYTKNASTDFLGTKRVEEYPWFSLIGAVANDSGVGARVPNDGSPFPHQYIHLPDHTDQAPVLEKSGYLYCFPNDVWSLYGNNHGSVQLTVKRVS